MKKPENIPLNRFHYELPDSRIAKYPLQQRDRSKLLVYENNKIAHDVFTNIGSFLDKKTHLVYNDSKVIHARLIFRKTTGAKIEIFCLEPSDPFDYQLNFASRNSVEWKCIVGNSKKWKNEILRKSDDNDTYKLFAKRISKAGNEERIRFSWEPDNLSFSEIIEKFGGTPIPPYLGREAEKNDSITYQTVYSKHEGSVAAPTAGLHFTDKLIEKLNKQGVSMSEVTLHVGAGTFTPVKVEDGLEHKMHIERFHINKTNLERLIKCNKHITPVGTTSCRSLESIYWMGVKLIMGYATDEFNTLGQFEAYELDQSINRENALIALLNFLHRQNREILFGSTGIMISPGYRFQMTDALITNFHQPGSTLLMLISALVGDKWKQIYEYALQNDFRFLSYGDSSLLFRNEYS